MAGEQATGGPSRATGRAHPWPSGHCGRADQPVLRPQSWPPVTELSLQDGELMAQNEDLNVLLTVRHQQQPQHGEGVGHSEVGEADQHETRSCRTVSGHASMAVDLHGCIYQHVQRHDVHAGSGFLAVTRVSRGKVSIHGWALAV
jgi:hypothetical protein